MHPLPKIVSNVVSNTFRASLKGSSLPSKAAEHLKSLLSLGCTLSAKPKERVCCHSTFSFQGHKPGFHPAFTHSRHGLWSRQLLVLRGAMGQPVTTTKPPVLRAEHRIILWLDMLGRRRQVALCNLAIIIPLLLCKVLQGHV